jgi:hypothetical protein
LNCIGLGSRTSSLCLGKAAGLRGLRPALHVFVARLHHPTGRIEPESVRCQGCSRSILSGMCPVRTIPPVPPSPLFSQVLILKEVKVLCFDTLLQVLILQRIEVEPAFGRGLPGLRLGDVPGLKPLAYMEIKKRHMGVARGAVLTKSNYTRRDSSCQSK